MSPAYIPTPPHLATSRYASQPQHTLSGCRDVRISPTVEEVLCKDPPWLPRNAAGAYHPLEGVERLLDVHFRLLRHDSLQTFFDNAQLLLAPAAAAAEGGECCRSRPLWGHHGTWLVLAVNGQHHCCMLCAGMMCACPGCMQLHRILSYIVRCSPASASRHN